MKRIYYLSAALCGLFLTASCAVDGIQEGDAALDCRVYSAEFHEPSSKAVLSEGTKMLWEPGDRIMVYDGVVLGDRDGVEYVADIEGTASSASFVKVNPESVQMGGKVLALYPAAADASGSAPANIEYRTISKVRIPSSQSAVAGSFDPDCSIAVAYSEDENLSFRNVNSLLKFKVGNEGVSKVRIRAFGGESLTGYKALQHKDDGPVAISVGSAGETDSYVEVVAAEGTFEVGREYYASVYPQILQSGFEVEFVRYSSTLKVKSYEGSVELRRNVILNLGTFETEELFPVLEASVDEVDLAFCEAVYLTVTFGGADVTSQSSFTVNGSDASNVFIPKETGSYICNAVYEGKQSNSVTINVVDSGVTVESKYERHVCIFEFTGAWCIYCPDGHNKMAAVLSKSSLAEYKDNIHVCAFHSDMAGSDAMAISATQDIMVLYKGLGYPSFVTDMRTEEGSYDHLTADGIVNLEPSIMASFNDYPAHCGVAVASTVKGGEASVTVKVVSEFSSEYSVVLLVVEDQVLAPRTPQKSLVFPDGQYDYVHRHVVRKVVTSYGRTFSGEKITDIGLIKAGEELSKTWTFELDSEWNIDNTEIYALILDSDGYVNNVNVCDMDGEADYILK